MSEQFIPENNNELPPPTGEFNSSMSSPFEIGEPTETSLAPVDIGDTALGGIVSVEYDDDPYRTLTREEIQQLKDRQAEGDDKGPEQSSSADVNEGPEKEKDDNASSMHERFDSITDGFNQLSNKFVPISETISRLPDEINGEIDVFKRFQSDGFEQIGQTLGGLRNTVDQLEDASKFFRNLEYDNPNEEITTQDRNSARELMDVVGVASRFMNSLAEEVQDTRRRGTTEQENLAYSANNAMQKAVRGVEEFTTGDLSGVLNDIDQTGMLHSEQIQDRFKDENTEEELSQSDRDDENHIDKLGFVRSKAQRESYGLLDDVEETARNVNRSLSLDSVNYTQEALGAARLHPHVLEDLSAKLRFVGNMLDMASSMRGTKGNMYAEIGYRLPSSIREIVDEVQMFMKPDIEYTDQPMALSKTQRSFAEIRVHSQNFEGSLRQMATQTQVE